jgi:hypothetical protein
MDMGGQWMLDAGLFVFMATTAAEIMTEKDGQGSRREVGVGRKRGRIVVDRRSGRMACLVRTIASDSLSAIACIGMALLASAIGMEQVKVGVYRTILLKKTRVLVCC